jgi:hypothetical protein
MKSKFWLSAALLFLLSSFAQAQDSQRQFVLALPGGGFVGLKSETAWAAATASSSTPLQMIGEYSTRTFVDEQRVVHRLLLDAAGRYIFGYDIVIEPVLATKKFSIALKQLDARTANDLLAHDAGERPSRIATIPQATEAQLLDDGDSFALDLLVNQKSGVKIVDFVRVSFDRAILGDDNPKVVPRDFTPDAVALTVTDFRLLIDGNLVAKGKPGTTFSGGLIWCYVEGQGRFIFSLVAREDYQFQKVGIIRDNRIEFSVKGKHYEWLSSVPIIPGGGTWNLWMLHDPTYLPFGSSEIDKQEKGRLEKWNDSIKAAEAKIAKPRNSITNGYQKKPTIQNAEAAANGATDQQTGKRFRVMVGAADRIENLLPK